MSNRGKSHHLHRPLDTDPPAVRARILLQDPKVARSTSVGEAEIELPGETWLGSGPTSSRFRVVDRDASTGETHPPVTVRPDGTGFEVGRGAVAGNFPFHQVNVWATVARLLAHLESPKVFGRRIPWAFDAPRLELYPHAEVLENAYYERESASIRFGYFDLDGKRVYTCLSHDVIAHEFGHAVLDGIKPRYEEAESPDPGAFHEFFGDAVAMISALTMDDLIGRLLRRSTGDGLGRLAFIADLMEEWGSVYGDRYIRSARNRKTMQQVRDNFEEHDRSEVLSGAAYDIFRGIYARLHREESQVDAVIHAADHTSRLIFRAVDYCPPVGLDFHIYAGAILRSDEVAYPVDDRGYREIVGKVLEKRGIGPAPARPLDNDALRPYDVEQLAASETDAYIFLDRNREALGIPRRVDFWVSRVYETAKVAARGYFPPREIVIEFVWCQQVRLRGSGLGRLAGTLHALWCGGTLVLDGRGNVLHYVLVVDDEKRRRLLHRYLRYLLEEGYLDEEEATDAARAAPKDLAGRRARAVAGPGGARRVVRIAAARCVPSARRATAAPAPAPRSAAKAKPARR